MNFRYPHPDNERSFEKFCLKLLQRHWNNPHLELYGRRGEKQSGVDIIDPTFSNPFKAAQCKHHEPNIKIYPCEIENEVAKALTFRPSLNHFAIVTSGRATTHAQNKIIEINRDHRIKGLFIVELLWWEKIEDLIDDYPDVAELLTKIKNSHIAILGEQVTQGIIKIQSRVDEAFAISGQNASDSEIDEAENCLKHSDPQRARMLLERLRQRHWEELKPQQKYRIKVAFSNASLVQGNDQEAGRLLLEAKDLCSDSERAQINEALGLELVGSKEKAHALAIHLRGKYPYSGKVLSILIRTAPGTVSLEDMKELITQGTENDAEVCMALAIRAMAIHRFSDAAYYGKKAVDSSPDWFGSRFILGEALYNAEAVKLGRCFRAGSDPIIKERLIESIAEIDVAITLAKSQADHLLSQCYLIRALANILLCEDDRAEHDFYESIRTGPENCQAHRQFAIYLYHRNRTDEAIVELRKAIRCDLTYDSELLLAELLSERDKPGDRASAIEIFSRLALADDNTLEKRVPEYKIDHIKALQFAAFHSAINEYIDANRLDDAEAFVSHVPSGRFSDVSILTSKSQVRLARGDVHDAITVANDALQRVDAGTHNISLRAIALQLCMLERHKDALPIWQKITTNADYSNDVRNLVLCAERVKRYDVILEVAKSAREGGIEDTWLRFKEVEILGMFDLDGAVELLQDWIKKHPNDKNARLRLSHLGLKWRRLDLVDARLDSIPSVEEVTAKGGAIAVEILRQKGDPYDALNYSYELVRRHYDHPDAIATLVMVLLSPKSQSLEIVEPVEAGPGAAVCFTEDGERDRWVVLEDSPNPRQELNEYETTHPLAVSLKGKRIGECFVLSKTSGRDRTAVIKKIKSKYLYRLDEIMDSWQVRFPDRPFIQVFRMVSQDATTCQVVPDLTDLKLVADRRYERINDAENAYMTQFIPLHLLSKIAGCGPFRAIYYVALRDDLPVMCNQGRQDEHDQALESLASSNKLVLDLTAIGSISLMRLENLLTTLRWKLVISLSTATELRSTLEEITFKSHVAGHFGKSKQGYFFHEYSEDGMKDNDDALASLLQTVLRVSEIRGCPEIAEIDPDKRDHLISIFGQHGVESMLLARQPGYALWSDDIAVGVFASSEFSVSRVWTQVVVEHGVNQGYVALDEYLIVSAKLLGLDYKATTFNPFVLAKAGSMSNWNPEKWPMNKVLEQIVNPSMQHHQVIMFVAFMLIALYKEASMIETRQAVLIKILERLYTLPNGIDIATAFVSNFPVIFGFNVIASREASEIGHSWLSEARRRPSLYIPRIRNSLEQ